jgi:hypothetical protein
MRCRKAAAPARVIGGQPREATYLTCRCMDWAARLLTGLLRRWRNETYGTPRRSFEGETCQLNIVPGCMSTLGHKLRRRVQSGMSALPPKAATPFAYRRVRFGPKANITRGALAP